MMTDGKCVITLILQLILPQMLQLVLQVISPSPEIMITMEICGIMPVLTLPLHHPRKLQILAISL
jgi:hypothetical protein